MFNRSVIATWLVEFSWNHRNSVISKLAYKLAKKLDYLCDYDESYDYDLYLDWCREEYGEEERG